MIAAGRRALAVEIEGLQAVGARIDASFAAACRIALACRGRIVVTGMGKSGHVASKIAATLEMPIEKLCERIADSAHRGNRDGRGTVP